MYAIGVFGPGFSGTVDSRLYLNISGTMGARHSKTPQFCSTDTRVSCTGPGVSVTIWDLTLI